MERKEQRRRDSEVLESTQGFQSFQDAIAMGNVACADVVLEPEKPKRPMPIDPAFITGGFERRVPPKPQN